MLRKVVILGPESTGKSTLCEQLAGHYETTWCPEYARTYLVAHGKKYDYGDLLTIAKGQVALEDEFFNRATNSQLQTPNSNPHSLLFIDTDMYVMKVWCEFVFGKCHPYILSQITKRKYDLYLLCNTDLPWVKDELREYPDPETRQRLYHIYKEIMISQAVPWVEISGTNEERLQQAITAIDTLLKN